MIASPTQMMLIQDQKAKRIAPLEPSLFDMTCPFYARTARSDRAPAKLLLARDGEDPVARGHGSR